jgi:hypothetical protein
MKARRRINAFFFCQLVHILCSDVHILCSDVHILCSDVHILCSDVHILCSDVHIFCSDVYILCSDVHILCSDVRKFYNWPSLLLLGLPTSLCPLPLQREERAGLRDTVAPPHSMDTSRCFSTTKRYLPVEFTASNVLPPHLMKLNYWNIAAEILGQI